MRYRLVRWMAVASLTIVLGGHWAALQSVAWVTMAAGYARAEPLKAALVKTFDGKHPCLLCKFVAAGKKSQRRHDASSQFPKLDLFLVKQTPDIDPPPLPPMVLADPASPVFLVYQPRTPPPRAA